MGEFLAGILSRLRTEFDPEVVGESVAIFVSNLAVGLITFAGFYLLWRLANHALRVAIHRSKVDVTSASFLQTALKYVVLTIGALQALSASGVNTAAFIASLGIAGLTIGFAARDALSNLISGILIFWDRPFVIGDLVEVQDSYGRVDRITLRSTRIVTVDGKMLAVPNSTIINSTVASYTNFPHFRIAVTVGVGVNEDIDRIRGEILALIGRDPSYMEAPPPSVVVSALNDYNVELQVRAWIKDEREHIALTFALREAVYKLMTRLGVDMPFETLRLAASERPATPEAAARP